MNVSNETINAIYQLISECFKENRYFDRYVTCLNVDFAMNNTSNLCHLQISHMFPILADKIGETIEKYNISIEYGATPEAKEIYSSPMEIIEKMENDCINFQNMFIGVTKIAFEHNDIQVYTELLDLLKDYNTTVEQVILLKDKADLYKDDWASYDAHIKNHFWVLGG